MKEEIRTPVKVVFKEEWAKKEYPNIKVEEFAIMPSGRIVVMVEMQKGFPESLWFDTDGDNPKSKLIFRET